MKKLLLSLLAVASVFTGAKAQTTFGITREIAATETSTTKAESGAAVTGRALTDDILVGESADANVAVAMAHVAASTMTDKARLTYHGTTTCYVDKGIRNYRTTAGTINSFSDNNYFAFTLTVSGGKALDIVSINGDICSDAAGKYQMSITNGEGDEVYTSLEKSWSQKGDATKSVAVAELAEDIQAKLTGMTGTIIVKMRWTNATSGKYVVIKDFNVTANVVDAAAQSKYSKPSITQGAYDVLSGTYAVTLDVQNDEDGVINYTVGSAEKVEGVASGTVINVAPNTTVTATVSGSTYSESDEQSLTTAAAPKLATPTSVVAGFNFATGKYTLELACAAGDVEYSLDNGESWTAYTEALLVEANATVKAKAVQTNMTTSDVLTVVLPAAPADGVSSTPATAGTYTDGMTYNAGAFTIPSTNSYIGGQISSGKSSINNSIKMRVSRNADPSGSQDSKYGFHILVNPGYVLTSLNLQMLNNYNTPIALTGVFADNSTNNLLTESYALPYASENTVAAINVPINDIAATEKVVFVFEKTAGDDEPNQIQVLISANAIVPVYNTGVTPDGFGTMYYEKELVCPEGTTAYTGTLNGNTLVLSELAGGVIPAYTPAVISGQGGLFTLGTSGAAAVASDLKGTAEEIVTSTVEGGTVCVLGYASEKAGFYAYNGEKLGANKAYLVVPSADASAIRIVVEGMEDGMQTAISLTPSLSEGEGACYDLYGRRTNGKGLMLQNGKVVFVK